jgi:hypothetical protein
MDAAMMIKMGLALCFEIARQHGVREAEFKELFNVELKKYINRDPRELPDA